MLEINLPSRGQLAVRHLVLDLNGTLAEDGALIDGVAERLHRLADQVKVHVITADTHGDAAELLAGLPVDLEVLPDHQQDLAKQRYVRTLSARECVTIGNGRNDSLMLSEAALGVAVIQREAASRQAIEASDVVCTSILDALDLLLIPTRLIATLRN